MAQEQQSVGDLNSTAVGKVIQFVGKSVYALLDVSASPLSAICSR